MQATAWNNGNPTRSGSGYGLKITAVDRDRYFDRRWTDVQVDVPGEGFAVVPLSESFWNHCTELRSASIGRWLLNTGLAPWSKGAPPTLSLNPIAGDRFELDRLDR